MGRAISVVCLFGVVVLVLSVIAIDGQQTATRYDYLRSNEALINAGMQSLFICNGLFVSNRTMEQLYGAELKMGAMPLAPPNQILIDRERKTVAICDGSGAAPVMRTAQREEIGR